ncbi:MAG: hypothetical protein ACR2RB_07515 [Gammaproteobacteria bacterium]
MAVGHSFEFETPGVRDLDRVRCHVWRYYCILAAWPAFLLCAPGLIKLYGGWSLTVIAPLGIYLFNWLALLLHESWHRYMPGFNNDAFFRWSSRMLALDPQLFRLIHAHHHTRVSTWDDIEVHPFGNIQSRPLRIANNLLELMLGMLWIVVGWHINVPLTQEYRAGYSVRSLLISTTWTLLFLALLFLGATFLLGATPGEIITAWALIFWLGGLFLHHSTLIQHGNLIVEGDIRERNRWVRGLRPAGIVERVFLVLTQQDQVLHHWDPRAYHRLFRNNLRDKPHDAVLIDLRDYLILVTDIVLGHETEHTKLGIRTPASCP